MNRKSAKGGKRAPLIKKKDITIDNVAKAAAIAATAIALGKATGADALIGDAAHGAKALLKGAAGLDMWPSPGTSNRRLNVGAAGYATGNALRYGVKHLFTRIRSIVGRGDYESSEDLDRNPIVSGRINPNMGFKTGESVMVHNREFLGDVITSANAGEFSIQEFLLNPANALTFPVLSSIAMGYEEFIFHGLIVEIVSSSSNYAATGALGTMVVAYSANPNAPSFINKTQMENSANAISARFDRNMLYGVECAKDGNTQNSYFVDVVSGTPLPASATTMGKLTIATAPASGYATNSVVAEMHITYLCEFRKPRAPPARFGYAHLRRLTNGSALILGDPSTTADSDTYGAAKGVSATNTVITIANTIPGDLWRVSINWVGASTTTVVGTVTVVGGTPLTVFANNTAFFQAAGFGTAGQTESGLDYLIQITSASSLPTTLTFAGMTPPTTAQVDIVCSIVGSGLPPNLV